MPKPTKGPRLGGGPAHERLLLAHLASALFTHKSLKTPETKAKRLRPLAERLVGTIGCLNVTLQDGSLILVRPQTKRPLLLRLNQRL